MRTTNLTEEISRLETKLGNLNRLSSGDIISYSRGSVFNKFQVLQTYRNGFEAINTSNNEVELIEFIELDFSWDLVSKFKVNPSNR